MNVQVVYCNHRTADLSLRERLAFSSADQINDAYRRLQASYPASEVVVLSTCNRIELYAAQENSNQALQHEEIAEFLSDFHNVPTDEFIDGLLTSNGSDAVRHLFEVVSSIDSMVVGEPQIVSQVKEAYELARKQGTNGPVTNILFQRAVAVSARVRRETGLSEGRVSIASVAVGEFARSIFECFNDKVVLVVGAGEMARETLRYLNDDGIGNLIVVNRSRPRAQSLADEFGGRAGSFDELDECMALADVIVSTTGSPEPIVDVARFRRVRSSGHHRPVFIVDLGAPRDFEAAVGEVDENVFLYDIEDLQATCERNRRNREQQIHRASRIISEETDRFMHEVYHRATGPIIKQLREDWHATSQDEMELLFRKLPNLTQDDRRTIERSVARIVNKLLHPPLETLKDEARQGTPHGLVDALKRLFHLRE